MSEKFNIAIIPVDNRPVSYSLPQFIGEINQKINIIMPPRELLGGLDFPADIEAILDWLKNVMTEHNPQYLICALDTIAYGGIIPSRRTALSIEKALSHINTFKKILSPDRCKILAFSSIMRISDSNVNEEEKEYWDKYGKLIFKYSFLKHKSGIVSDNAPVCEELNEIKRQIPPEILEDYLKIRDRNFFINKTYLDLLQEKFFDYLVYGKDDTGIFGLNIQEANELEGQIAEKNLTTSATLHTGSDEVVSMLLTRALNDVFNTKISVFPIYSTVSGQSVTPRYEDKTLFESLKKHLTIINMEQAGSKVNADMLLLLNTPDKDQNDLALNFFTEQESYETTDYCIQVIKKADKPLILADIFCANGAASILSEKLLSDPDAIKKLYGYAAWNTASNTLGTALSIGFSRYVAEKTSGFSRENFNKLLFTRFADDWAYQTVARQEIRAITDLADEVLLEEKLFPLIKKAAAGFNINPDRVVASFPWDRTFEIEINILE